MSSTIKSPAQKAWDTRRKNGTAAPAAVTVQNGPDPDIIMHIGIDSDTAVHPIVTATFSYELSGKPISADLVSAEHKPLTAVRLSSIGNKTDVGFDWSGHDRVTTSLSIATASDLESLLPLMMDLDSMLAKSREDSEDSSLPMAMQALSWDRRIAWVLYDGKRSKRGAIYPMIESLLEDIGKLYASAG